MTTITKDDNLVYSYTFSLPCSPLKARRIIDAIRGRTYEDAIKYIEADNIEKLKVI